MGNKLINGEKKRKKTKDIVNLILIHFK